MFLKGLAREERGKSGGLPGWVKFYTPWSLASQVRIGSATIGEVRAICPFADGGPLQMSFYSIGVIPCQVMLRLSDVEEVRVWKKLLRVAPARSGQFLPFRSMQVVGHCN